MLQYSSCVYSKSIGWKWCPAVHSVSWIHLTVRFSVMTHNIADIVGDTYFKPQDIMFSTYILIRNHAMESLYMNFVAPCTSKFSVTVQQIVFWISYFIPLPFTAQILYHLSQQHIFMCFVWLTASWSCFLNTVTYIYICRRLSVWCEASKF